MPGGQWAQLRTEASVPLRRGAWYRVLRLTASDAVLDVHERPIKVPRPALRIAPRPPGVWEVVARPPNARSLPPSWGARYGVCRRCRRRSPLPKGPVAMRCAGCGGVSDVGWGESRAPIIFSSLAFGRAHFLSGLTAADRESVDQGTGERAVYDASSPCDGVRAAQPIALTCASSTHRRTGSDPGLARARPV